MNEAAYVPHTHHQAWFQLLRAHARLLRQVEQRLEVGAQIPLSWYDVLVTLEKAPHERLRMSELAESVVLSRSGLTRLVDRLEREGLLKRENCPRDKRGCFATITQQGLEARRAAWPIQAQAIAELFVARVTPEEAAVLGRVLGRVADAVSENETLELQVVKKCEL